ncbi:MAG: AAA family ATPase [Planctomycetes bacterium]|nr:AAA family ATPase [Planctomycetota bacterium]
MSGPSGTGKTLTIRAFLHEFYEMLRRLTGSDDIGSRVIRVKSADLLSQWFGVTDKNIDQLFDDIRALASQTFEVDGVPRRLPVVVILEEVESLSRRRGEADGAIYDRVLGMLLQRLDDPVEDIGQLPLIFISTSNRPELVDTAMWRRLGGRHAHFGRLNREGFRAVLSKKLKAHYPYLSNNGTPVEETRARVIDQVVNWLFSPNNDADGLVELTLRDGTKLIKHRRDFLTGAVVEQGVSNCIDHVVFAADETSDPRVGLDASNLIESLTDVIDGLASNLTPQNAADYVDLPEHSAVAHVRHLSGADSGRLFRLAR